MLNRIIYAGFPGPKDACGKNMGWKVYPDSQEGREQLKMDGYKAVSIYSFSHPVEKNKPRPIVYGDLVLDFDAKKDDPSGSGYKQGDIEKSLEGLRAFIRILIKSFEIDPKSLLIWASGGKGFHLAIPSEVIGSEMGDIELPMIYQRMIDNTLRDYSNRELWDGKVHEALYNRPYLKLVDFCIDSNTFKGNKGQLLRLPHIRRYDGNFKVPVSYDEILENDASYFVELVKNDRVLLEEEHKKSVIKNTRLENLFLEHKRLQAMSSRGSRRKISTIENWCEFIQFCRDRAEEVSEPQWFMLARILSHCGTLGNELFHEYSRRDASRYDPKEAQNKFIRTLFMASPTCEGVKSVFECSKNCGVKCPMDLLGLSLTASIGLENYRNTEEGLFFYESPQDLTNGFKVCSSLELKASARDAQNASWSKIVEFSDLDGNIHICRIPYNSLINRGEEALNILVDSGLRLEGGNKPKKLLLDYLQICNPDTRAFIADKNGWVENRSNKYLPFDLGEQSDGSDYLCMKKPNHKPVYTQNGTLDDWKEHIGKLCIDNPLLEIMVVLGIAGPMLKIMNNDGFGVHLYGKSSIGKTTCLHAASSVNGAELETWRTTDNALEGIAVSHNDNTLLLDEINQCDPDVVGSTAYMLANGRGKRRSTKTGETRNVAGWHLLFGSTGEMTIAARADQGYKNKSMAGHEVRVIGIYADGGNDLGIFSKLPDGISSPKEFVTRLHEASAIYKGMPIIALLRSIQKNPELSNSRCEFFEKEFLNKYETSQMNGQTLRVLHNMAFLAGVGEFAIELGIFPWPKGESIKAIGYCFDKWLKTWDGDTSFEIKSSRDKLLSLVRNGFYGRVDGEHPVKKEQERGQECYFVPRGCIVPDICPSYLYRELVGELDKLNLLIRGESGKPKDQPWYGTNNNRPRGIFIITKKVYELESEDDDKGIKDAPEVQDPTSIFPQDDDIDRIL